MPTFLRRRTGWKPDLPDIGGDGKSRDFSFEKLGLVRAAAPSSLRPYVVEVLDQANTNSCVAHAWEQAFRIRGRIAGGPWVAQWGSRLGSRLFGYRNSRRTHGEENVDQGTYLRSYAKAVNVFGRPPEEAWPFLPLRVNWTPKWNAYRLAFDSSLSAGPHAYYRIDAVGSSRAAAVRAALAAGYPVVFGTRVSQAFLNAGPSSGVLHPEPDPRKWVGGHAMCIVACDLAGNFVVVNSWSTNWGEGGFGTLSEEFITWIGAEDFWVVV